MTEQEIEAEKARIAKEREELEKERLAFSAEQSRQRKAQNDAAIDQLANDGKVLPADVPDLKLAFADLDKAGTIAFSDKSEASPAARILAIMAKAGPAVPINSQESPEHRNPKFSDGSEAKGNYDKALEEQAKRYGN